MITKTESSTGLSQRSQGVEWTHTSMKNIMLTIDYQETEEILVHEQQYDTILQFEFLIATIFAIPYFKQIRLHLISSYHWVIYVVTWYFDFTRMKLSKTHLWCLISL